MSIHAALVHRTRYTYDRPVEHGNIRQELSERGTASDAACNAAACWMGVLLEDAACVPRGLKEGALHIMAAFLALQWSHGY